MRDYCKEKFSTQPSVVGIKSFDLSSVSKKIIFTLISGTARSNVKLTSKVSKGRTAS